MTPLLRRMIHTSIKRVSVRSLSSPANDVKVQQPHIYQKTYTEDELIKYFVDNVVYKGNDLIVTSIPQGVQFLKENRWVDCENHLTCDVCLQDMIPNLCKTFNSEYIFISKHPRRCASGLVIFSKNFNSFRYLRNNFRTAEHSLKRIFTYLAVVIGSPEEDILKTFKIDQTSGNDGLGTEILEEVVPDSIKTRKTKYKHVVLEKSTQGTSLVRIDVSYDLRDCVRHILAQKCFTPVFGDSWNIRRTVKFLFDAPLKGTDALQPEPYKLSTSLLEKLHLTEDVQKYIPIHLHLYGVKLSLKTQHEFFVSVSPPESFMWTCRQLGLQRIREFVTTPTANQSTN